MKKKRNNQKILLQTKIDDYNLLYNNILCDMHAFQPLQWLYNTLRISNEDGSLGQGFQDGSNNLVHSVNLLPHWCEAAL